MRDISNNELDELEKLIDLAVEVSCNVQALQDRKFRLRTEMQMSTVIFMLLSMTLFILFINTNKLLLMAAQTIALIMIMSGFSIYNIYRLRARKSIDIELASEFQILDRLLEMVQAQKEANKRRGMGILQSAIVEMRIGRIKFSPDGRP